MVFSTLSQKDKEALFALLDEYFESRPELFQGLNHAKASPSVQASHASSPPARPLSPSRVTGAIQNGARSLLKGKTAPSASSSSLVSGPPAIPARQPTPRIVEPEAEQKEDIDEAPVSVSSRIAAAQAAIGGGASGKAPIPTPRRPSGPSPAAMKSTPPPRPLKSSPSASVTSTPVHSPSPQAPSTSSLVQSRGIGSIDTSSVGAAANTIWNFKGMGKNEKKPTGMSSPSTSSIERQKTRDLFGPPPRREVGGSPVGSPAISNQETLAADEEEEHGEKQGEWVVALYDFSSAETTDLSFRADDQIWVTERTSKDWWMAEIDGRGGLIPAAYVKPL